MAADVSDCPHRISLARLLQSATGAPCSFLGQARMGPTGKKAKPRLYSIRFGFLLLQVFDLWLAARPLPKGARFVVSRGNSDLIPECSGKTWPFEVFDEGN